MIIKRLKTIFFLLALWACSHMAYSVFDGLQDHNLHADVAIILGNTVHQDGSLSKRLEKRLECGLNLYKSGRVKTIIVSGGLGKEGHYEAEKMKTYLLKHQVNENDIIVDNYGNNTRLTVANTLKLKQQYKFTSGIVVSQYVHITRTKMLFRKQGFPISGVSPTYFELRDLYALPREFIAYYAQWF